jgi:hypothetical protein
VSLYVLFKRYNDVVQFLMIYIREVHPVDGWWLGGGLYGLILRARRSKAATDIYDPKTIEERRLVAGQCEEALRYGIKTYVDEMDDAVNQAYAAMPTRLYLVGVDGQVEYAAGMGPFGFKPTAFGAAIEAYLRREEKADWKKALALDNVKGGSKSSSHVGS